MVAKKELEFTDYREIDGEIGRKCKHSCHLLPIKKGKNYFHGEFCNGKVAFGSLGLHHTNKEHSKGFKRAGSMLK